MSFIVLSIQELHKDGKFIRSPSTQRQCHNVHSGEHVLTVCSIRRRKDEISSHWISACSSLLSSYSNWHRRRANGVDRPCRDRWGRTDGRYWTSRHAAHLNVNGYDHIYGLMYWAGYILDRHLDPHVLWNRPTTLNCCVEYLYRPSRNWWTV